MNVAIIVAAGKSTRMGAGVDKAFLPLGSKPVLAWSLLAFQQCEAIQRIILVVRKDQQDAAKALVKMFGISKLQAIVQGGKTRAESVQAGLAQCDIDTSTVVIHDGARPLVKSALVAEVVKAVTKTCGVVVGRRMTDTVKRVAKGTAITATVDRSELWTVQTPQAFPIAMLRSAYGALGKDDVTDDAQVVEKNGGAVKIFETLEPNLKITVPEDLGTALALMK